LELEENYYREMILEKDRQQLIIVATLLDKVPNIAGLVRTGEIFNGNNMFNILEGIYC
jgi:hypothetical protein